MEGAEIAKAFKIKIYSIGIYNPAGSSSRWMTLSSAPGMWLARPQIDENMMNQLAETTGGKYFRATDSKAFQEIFSEIDKLEKSKVEVKRYYRYSERFSPWAIFGLVMLVLSIALSDTYFRRIP